MNQPSPGYSPRRRGEVVRVSVHEGAERPVHIECHEHAHTYDVAWRDAPDGPVVTDLRVTSNDGTPITFATLRRINTDRLARTAAKRRDELSFVGSVADEMRAGLAARGIEPAEDGHVFELSSWEEQGPLLFPKPARRGRPTEITQEFLAQVAAWAREAAAEGHAIYPYIAEKAGSGRTADTVKGWVRRAKDAGLLRPDELRRPRRGK